MIITYKNTDLEIQTIHLASPIDLKINGIAIEKVENGLSLRGDVPLSVHPKFTNVVEVKQEKRK